MVKIKTGLKDTRENLDILEGVSGQLSDGIWENSSRMVTYWRNCHIGTEDGEIYFEVPDNYWAYYNTSRGDEQAVRTWWARKVKQVVKEYIKDHASQGITWKRNDQNMIRYFHGDWNSRTWPTVAQAYYVYDVLLGRK